MGDELFHADGRTDGQTDMIKLIVTFRKFTKAPKNQSAKCVSDIIIIIIIIIIIVSFLTLVS